MSHRMPLPVPRSCWLRNPQGAPVDGRVQALLYDRDPFGPCRPEEYPALVGAEVHISRASPNGPLVVHATASPVHVRGCWTFHLETYPVNPGWPPRRRKRTP